MHLHSHSKKKCNGVMAAIAVAIGDGKVGLMCID